MKQFAKWFFILAIAGIILVSTMFYIYIYKPLPIRPSCEVHIFPGSSPGKIARTLVAKGVIRNSFFFEWYFRIFYRDETMKAGEYTFNKPMNARQVIFRLVKGEVTLTTITIKEGLTITEIAQLLDRDGFFPAYDFIAAALNTDLIRDFDGNAQDLEGYLFPETYRVHKGITADEFVQIMVGTFKRNFNSDLIWRCRDIQFTVREAIALASLIEKETSVREERFRISAVFHNRLRLKMRLDCDPTVIYALMRENRYRGKLSWNDLKYDSPYNTRIFGGLPPGPICNPGLASIEGALYPENSKYLYFVSKDGREHYFSETLAEHNRAVRQFILQKNVFGR